MHTHTAVPFITNALLLDDRNCLLSVVLAGYDQLKEQNESSLIWKSRPEKSVAMNEHRAGSRKTLKWNRHDR